MNTQSSGKYELLDQIAEEFAERFRHGERPALHEYTQRYPELAAEIRELFPAMVEIERVEPAVKASGVSLRQVGDYRLLREIGRGGMGVVYEAEQSSLGRRVALKVLPLYAGANARALERFKREARAAAKLHHTNIVPVFEVGEDGQVCFYAMQYIQGQGLDQVIAELRRLRSVSGRGKQLTVGNEPQTQDLRELARSMLTGQFGAQDLTAAAPVGADTPEKGLEGCGSFPSANMERQAPGVSSCAVLPGQTDLSVVETDHRHYFESIARIGRQTASALAHAHERGIIHRDIKPSNLLLDASGTVWVTDFGLAKMEEGDLTNPGDILGTFRYMAPERFNGRSDPRSDVYALGITLYELLVLRPAFQGCDRATLVAEIATEEPPRPRTLDRRVPRDLETIVVKAIDKDPARRYQTADALAEDLRRFVDGEPIRARRTGLAERARLWSRRHPALAGLYLVLFLAALCSTFFASYLHSLRQESEALRTQKQKAEQEKTEQLYQSLVDQALASGLSRRMGQRYESLRFLGEAAKIARELNKPETDFLRLRNEAIACMALRDLKVAKEWDGWSEVAQGAMFDDKLERYARMDRGGRVSISSVTDAGAEIRGLSGKAFTLSPDGRFLALHKSTADWGIWDLASPEASPVWRMSAPPDCFAFSADSRQFAASTGGGMIDVHELPSGKRLRHLKPGPRPNVLVFHPRQPRLALAHRTGVAIRDLETGEIVQQLSYPFEYYPAAAWHPDGRILAAVGGDQIIRFWDVDSGKEISKLEGFKNGGNTLAFNASGDLVATSGWEGRLRLWDWRFSQPLLNVPFSTTYLRFSADGEHLACGVELKKMTVWQVSPGREYRTLVRDLALGKGLYGQPAISPDGRLLVVAMRDGFGLWDLPSGRPVQFVAQRWTTSVRFEPSGSLLTFGEDGLIRWPLVQTATDVVRLGPPNVLARQGAAAGAGQSKDGKVTAFGLLARGAGVLHENDDRRISRFLAHGDVWGADVSPDGRWVVTGCHHSTGVRIWEARSGKLAGELLTQQNSCGVGFSPDSKWLATTGGGLRLWHVDSWQAGPDIGGREFAFSHDGNLLAVETGQGILRLVDPGSGREYARLKDPNQDRAGSMAFSSDGGLLAVTSGDSQSIHAWDLRTIRQELAKMGLDWDLPPLPPAAPPPLSKEPLRVQIDAGNLVNGERKRDLSGSRTVSRAAKGTRHVFVDPAHALTDVIDFHDRAGATLAEFHAWRAALGADFRLALLTSRNETGRSLINAVAVRESKPRPAKFYAEMTLDEGNRTWDRMSKEGRCVLTCDFTKKGQPVTSQLWLPGEGNWSQWYGPLATVVDRINDDGVYRRRPVYLHGPMPGGDGDYFRVNGGNDAGRKWKIAHALSADQLLSTVASCSGDGWRPDVLAPYVDGGRLLFMLVTVDNHDAVDWQFRMDMSLQEYRAESAEQKRQGLFPLALVSYKDNADARYAAIWVRYRVMTNRGTKK
jgi:serine/threonine protein kinase/WD40 repeat protein